MAEIDTLNTVLTSTLTRSRKKLIWAVVKSHVLYAWASANDRVEVEDGGHGDARVDSCLDFVRSASSRMIDPILNSNRSGPGSLH